ELEHRRRRPGAGAVAAVRGNEASAAAPRREPAVERGERRVAGEERRKVHGLEESRREVDLVERQRLQAIERGLPVGAAGLDASLDVLERDRGERLREERRAE